MMHSFRPDIIQFAWVVPNLEEAARRWHAALGVGPFLINRNLALIEPRHRGRPSATRFSMAVAQSGEFQVELIEQHDAGPSVYRDTVAPGHTGLHHDAIIPGAFAPGLGHYTAQSFALG